MATWSKSLKQAATLCALTIVLPFSAHAAPVTWTIDATYTFGFAATGTFQYDADLGAAGFGVIDIDLTGPGGPFDIDSLTDCGGADQNGPNGFTFATDSACAGPAIQVRGLPFAMTNAGGTISIAHADVSSQSIACNVGCGTAGFALAGSVITTNAVPEPATLAMVGIGLLGLALQRKRS